MLDLLGQQRNIGLAKSFVLLLRVRQARGLQRLRDETRIRPPAEVLIREGVGDAEGLRERARHRPQARPTTQEQGAIDIKKNKTWFHEGAYGAKKCVRGLAK